LASSVLYFQLQCFGQVLKTSTGPSQQFSAPFKAEAVFLVVCNPSVNQLWATYIHRDIHRPV